MTQPPKDILFDRADFTLLREVLQAVHDNVEFIGEILLGCNQDHIRILQDKLADGHETPEGVSVSLVLPDLWQLTVCCILASNFHEPLHFTQPNAEEIIDALSERIGVLDERYFGKQPSIDDQLRKQR